MNKLKPFLKENTLSIFSLLVMVGAVSLIVIQGPVKKDIGGGKLPFQANSQESLGQASLPDINGWPFLGNPDAKVVFVEYGDYKCGFCGRFNRETLPKLKEKYIDTGKVKFVWKDLVIFGEDSLMLAQGAHCAGEQGKFFELHNELFSEGPEKDSPAEIRLISLGQKLNLDMKKFSSCLNSGKYVEKINQSVQEAGEFGFSGTPTAMINGEVIVGAQPVAKFESMINSFLAK